MAQVLPSPIEIAVTSVAISMLIVKRFGSDSAAILRSALRLQVARSLIPLSLFFGGFLAFFLCDFPCFSGMVSPKVLGKESKKRPQKGKENRKGKKARKSKKERKGGSGIRF